MKLRIFFVVFILLMFSSFSSQGQELPEEFVNTWEYYGADESQILTIYSDGSFVFFREERSARDVTDEDCERNVEASSGSIEIDGDEMLLVQEASYSIEYPACGLRVDGDVEEEDTDELVFEVELDGGQLLIDDLAHNGRFAAVSLESVDVSDDEPIPAAFVGEWVSDFSADEMTLRSVLNLSDDGSYIREYAFITEDSELISQDSGEASLDGLVLTLEQSESLLIIDGEEFAVDTDDEQNVVWLASEDGRMSIYINGLVSYLDGETAEQEEEEGEEGEEEEEQPTTVSFEEDFEENDFAWEEGEGDGYVSVFDDGVYVMEFNDDADSTGWIVGPGFDDWDLAPIFEGSYSFQFDIRGECDGVCGVGTVVGIQEAYEGGIAMYYWPLDDRDGFFRFADWNEGDVLDEGEPFDRIDIFDGDWHTLRMDISEENMEFFIDGDSIYEYDDGDFDTEGSIAFMMVRDDAEFEFEVEFDNVLVESAE